ncbi:MAG: restriction endonuclease subunit S, partial [bacterium]
MDNIGYIPLSFMRGDKEIHSTITNTVIFKYVFNQYSDNRKIGDLLNKTQYGYNTSAKKNGKYNLVRITDIRNGSVNWESVPYCDCNDENKYKLTKGDILIARTGGTTGKSYLISNIPYDAVFASYLIRLQTNGNLIPEYLYLFLNSYFYWSQVMELKGGA